MFLIISLVSCTNTNDELYIQTKEDYKKILQHNIVVSDDWTLFISGEKTDIPVIIAEESNETFVCVPVLPVLNYLGVKISDKTNVYELKYNGEILQIDFHKQIIHTKHSEFNLLKLPTGGKIYYKFFGNDVISCGPSLTGVLHYLDLDFVYHVYYDSKTIKMNDA